MVLFIWLIHGKTEVITFDALKGHELMKELMVKILLILEEIYIFIDLEFDAITCLSQTRWQHDETSIVRFTKQGIWHDLDKK
jgi:hypothetical protein